MNSSTKIHSRHLDRQAVVYLRQSSMKQVRQNQESARNQRALTERLLEFGWKPDQVSVIDEDQGQSAAQSAGRVGFQRLIADVSLGKIGIIVGYEVSRLSRNCADWHQLLELCALFDTLIGDVDGIYDPRDFNDRLLLGLKGTMSAAELHSIRLRLDAGRKSKARRGELVQHLPTGLTRNSDGSVMLDPDESVRERITLVFTTFQEVGTIQKVLTHFVRSGLQLPRRQTSGLYAGQTLWKDPAAAALGSILKNPAYAGAFAYGRRIVDPSRRTPGKPASGRSRRPREEWAALVHDVYPAYIDWQTWERIQKRIAQNTERMQKQLTARQATRSGSALLTGLVRCGKCGRAMCVSYKSDGDRYQYVCQAARSSYGKRSCQFLSGREIDAAVVESFQAAVRPAEIDAIERLSAEQLRQHSGLMRELERDAKRLQYAAHRAEQQYDSVDPRNRLIAASLEDKWESALHEWGQAREKLDDAQRETPKPLIVPMALREAFADAGQQLPTLWPELTVDSRKSLLRTLVHGVNLLRASDGTVQIRIVWPGRLVTERYIRLRCFTLRDSELERETLERIREFTRKGFHSEFIAARLNALGLHPCRSESFTAKIVNKLKHRHGIITNRGVIAATRCSFAWTTNEIAQQLGRHPSWISRRIRQGAIEISADPIYSRYLFPRSESILHALTQLRDQKVSHVKVPQIKFPEGYCNG